MGEEPGEFLGNRVVEGMVEAIYGFKPYGFKMEKVARSFEEVGKKREKTSPKRGGVL